MKMKNCIGAVEGNCYILLRLIAELMAFIVVVSKACPSGKCVYILTKNKTSSQGARLLLQRHFLRVVWTKKRLNNVAKTFQFLKSSVRNMGKKH
jgi:hypothetical protein